MEVLWSVTEHTAPGLMALALEWEVQAHFVSSVSEVRCHISSVLGLGVSSSLFKSPVTSAFFFFFFFDTFMTPYASV